MDKGFGFIKINISPTTPEQQETATVSAYQQNLQKPVQQQKWYAGEQPTSREMLKQIYTIYQQDKEYGQKALDAFHADQQNPASIFYSPYSQNTNKAVQNLASYGIDASQINEAWYKANPEWQSYLIYNGTTNTPSKPGKKATTQQKIAYEIYQLGKADKDTQNMQSEWAAMQDELAYWARRTDLNMSDDEIVAKVQREMQSKYPTLYRMQESMNPGGVLLELNTKSDFSTDGMYGTIWAARNGGGTGNMESNVMLSAMGEGSVWQDNADTRAKLDRNNKDTFSPYEVGMTLNDVGLYFGYSGFNDEVLEHIRQNMDWNDQTAVRNFNEAVSANETTKQAETELTELYKQVDTWIKGNRAADWIIDKVNDYMDDGEWKTLKSMDDSIRTGGKIVDTTRAIPYRRQIIDDYIQQKTTERDSKLSGGETANNVKGSKPGKKAFEKETPAAAKPQETPVAEEPQETPMPEEPKAAPVNQTPSEEPPMTEADIARGKETDKKINNVGGVLDGVTTDDEKTVWANAGSSFFDGTKLVFQDAQNKTQTLLIGMAQNSEKAVTEHFFNATMDNIYGVARYEAEQDALAEDKKQFAELQAKYGDVADYRQEFKPSMISTVQYGNEDVNVSLRWNDAKGKYIVADITAPGLGIYGMNDDRFAYVYDKNSEGYALTQLAEKAADDASVTASKAKAAQERLDAASETEKAEIERYKRLDGSIRKREDELNKGEKEYIQQKEDMDAAWKNLGIINSALQDLGMDTVNIEQIQLMSEYLSQFFDEPALPRSEETYYQWAANVAAYSEGGATTENVSATLHTLMDGVNDEIDKLNMALEFVEQNGYKLPDNVYRNMQYGMQDLENKKKGIEYSLMMTDVDEGEKQKAIEAGKAFEKKHENDMRTFGLLVDNGTEERTDKYMTMYGGRYSGSDYLIYNEKGEDGSIGTNYFELITPEEEDLYYYLLGQKVLEREGELDELLNKKYWTPEDTALVKDTLDDIFGQSNDFLDYMDDDDYGVWTSRKAEYTKLHAQGVVDSGWAGGALMNIAGTVATPAESLVNAIYLLDRKVNDKRINPDSEYRTISMAKEATRSATFQSIKDTYGDGTWQEKLASFGYEIYCNRGDSLMNSLAFGGLFKFGGKFGNMINSFLGATPMGATAALNAAAEAVENGANTDQAWLIAGMTFFSETLTEAITLGNIKEAFSTVEELSDDTLKGIIKDWLLDNGVEEAFGESINDIAENAAARWAASMKHSNYQDEFGQMVEKFMGETGCSREEAEEMALEEQARGVLHTAIVSYLSAGSEAVIATGKAALNTTNYYKTYTKSRQKIGYGESTLDNMLHDWRVSKGIETETKTETAPKAQTKAEADFAQQSAQEDKAYARQARVEQDLKQAKELFEEGKQEGLALETRAEVAAQEEAESSPASETETAEAAPVAETETAEAEPVAEEAQEEGPKVYRGGVSGDILLIEEAKGSDASTKSAALATALTLDVIKEKRARYGYQDYTADAAGAFATSVFGENADSIIQEILSGARDFHLNANSIKMAIQNAILGDGAATALVQTDEFRNANPVQKARMMARTLQEDMYNDTVTANAQAKIAEFRKTRVVTQLAGQGHFDNAVAARAAANKAKQTSVRMNQNLETQRNVEQAAAEATAKAGEAVAAEPTRENVNALNHAVTEQENQSKVTQEYEQAKEKADNDHKAAEEKAVQAANDAMNEARAIADQQIAQEDQQQAEAEAQRAAAEEQAAQEQAEAEHQQLLEDQRSGKLEEDSYEEKIRRLAEERGLKGEQAEKFVKDVLQFAKDKRMGNVDMTKQMSETEANLMMGALSRRFNINVRIGDTDNNANGQHDPSTNTITLNKNLTAGQVLLEFSLHELTHSLESTKSYGKYHDTALNILYASEAEKKQAVADKMAEYEAAGHPITAEQAERELVADFTRTRLNDKNVVARMVDAGLGGRMRNALHNINQFLKNITGRMSEEERLQAEQLRRAERAFQKAINERTKAQKASNQAGETELSIGGAMTEAQKAQAIKEASQDYNDALARMDYKAAQEDVDFAAEEAGYVPEAAYHGTSDFGFTEFDTNIAKEEGTIFVAFNPTTAYTYSRAGVRTVSSARPQTMSNEELIKSALEVSENTNSGVTNIQFNNGKFDFTFDDGTTESLTREEVVDSIQQYSDYGEQVALGETETKQDDFFDFSGMTEEENLAMRTKVNNGRGTYKLYTRPGNQLVVDAQGRNWDDIPVQWSDESVETNDIARYAKENGYDSVRINNVIDHGGRALNEMEAGRTDVGIFFNANDVKSADTVTRDDNGNVIPLDERFNTASNDIRYSVGGEMTTADMDQALVDAGILTQKQLDRMNKTDTGEGTRQWGTHMAQDMDELAEQAREYVKNHSAYQQDTNKEQIDRAVEWFKKNAEKKGSFEEAYSDALMKITDNKFNFRSADGQARMAVMMGMAIARGDIYGQVQIARQVNRQGTALGQALQSRKLFRLMTPEGRISMLARMLDDQKDELMSKGKVEEAEKLKFSDWLIRAAGAAENEGDMALVRQAAINELADQLPANFADRIRSLRMLSMLANPRTHIRNIIGNALFIPAVSIKNKIGALGEIVTRQDERTKTLKLTSSKEIRAYAREMAKSIKDVLTGEAKYTEATQLKKAQGGLGKFMDGLSDLNSRALEGEDWFFLKGHFRRAFGGWMTANGYTVEDVKNNPQLLQNGQQYAIDEAQKATYRDFNKTAAWLNQASRNGGFVGFVSDAVLPFKKTPANILKRGLEYSPIGIAKSLTYDMIQLHKYNKAMELYEQGKITEMPKNVKSPNQVIDDIASGLSGTAVMALGFLLAGTGAVSCGLDDDEDKFEKAKGGQKYSIKLFGEDVTYTMDWAAPMSMPFFVGAAIRNESENSEGFDFEKAFNAVTSIAEPIFNLSMLDGLNSVFKTSQYDDTNELTQIGAKILSNYITSYVPSFLGATTRSLFDDTSRKAFVKSGEGTGVAGTFRYAWEQVENKIPGLSKTNIPNRDIWGRPKSDELWERLVENFISPGYIEHYKDDPIINEMARLYTVTGDPAMIPKEDPEKKYTRTKNKVKEEFIFTAEEWDKYKEVRNSSAFNLLTELINSDEYNDPTTTDEMKVKMIDNVWSHATDLGRAAVVPDYEIKSSGKISTIGNDSKIAVYKSDLTSYLNKGDIRSYEVALEGLRQLDVKDSDIRGYIRDYFRDMYKDAYRKDDMEEMLRIQDLMTGTDFSKMNDLIRDWEKAVDNEAEEEE